VAFYAQLTPSFTWGRRAKLKEVLRFYKEPPDRGYKINFALTSLLHVDNTKLNCKYLILVDSLSEADWNLCYQIVMNS